MNSKPEPYDGSKTLADLSLREIASGFASALLDLTGNVYEVNITALDRRPDGVYLPEARDTVDIRMRARKPSGLGDWPATGDGEPD